MNLQTEASLSIEHRGAVAWLTMNKPQSHNAFDAELIQALTGALEAVDKNPKIRAVIITGAGSTFSAGADLNWMRSMAKASESENLADSLQLAKLMRTLNYLSKPTIARVNGAAYGGGDLGNGGTLHTEAVPCQGEAQSLVLTLPPLATLILFPGAAR